VALCNACKPTQLCDVCFGREMLGLRGQAAALGQTWGERVCRGEYQSLDEWPERAPRTLKIARRLVAALAADPRVLDELAAACSAGAAAWWRNRPVRYRRSRV
jgi:hypothetical protein